MSCCLWSFYRNCVRDCVHFFFQFVAFGRLIDANTRIGRNYMAAVAVDSNFSISRNPTKNKKGRNSEQYMLSSAVSCPQRRCGAQVTLARFTWNSTLN